MTERGGGRREMDKAYIPADHESALYDWWEAQGFFRPETQIAIGQAADGAPPFVIPMPPPNVTGALHMGHALTASVEDLLIRYHRLRGRPSLWVPGTDHAGIATQNVVERVLESEGTSRHELGRDAFVERVWGWKREYGDRITRQHRSLGASADWTRERFTMDEGLSRAVREAFVGLYERGLIYRGTYLVNWCPRCQTVISDIEVDHDEVAGRLYTFRYRLQGEGEIQVATTRPETILADTAVAVHPDDPRYTELVGRTALVPILDRPVPVIADAYVDMAFGTGALKITPGHDPNDYEIGKRHDLPEINILNSDGTLNQNAGGYAGLDRMAARERLWEDMRSAGLVVGEVEHVHQVGHCQRCHTVVEPLLSKQWFVRMAPLADEAMAAVRAGEVRFVPERFTREFFRWMENIRDWVISRQLWWGHRIPVWYGPEGSAFAARDQAEAERAAREQFGRDVELTQDEDVLDTWFSSGLWPFSTLGWPAKTDDLERYYPADVLETGYDILFFWVARMIVMGQAMTGRVPFHTVYLHGLVRDPSGRKMSKSLGNAIDPLETVAQYGCDALRFSLLTGCTPGMDMKLAPERLEGGRNFGNKLWNIGRFTLSVLPEEFEPIGLEDVVRWAADAADATVEAANEGDREGAAGRLSLADRWIVSRFNRVVAESTRLMDAYQMGEAGRELYEFAWGELADWYVESAKPTLGGGNPQGEATRQVLYNVLERTLALLHPFMPFVTEAVWGHLPRRSDDAPALIVSRWPEPGARDMGAEAAYSLIQELVSGIRNVRAEYEVEPGRRIAGVVSLGESGLDPDESAALLCGLARLDGATLVIGRDPQPPLEAYATVVAADGVEAWLPLAGLVDLERERARLAAAVAAAAAEVTRLEGVLANTTFTDRAPAEVVQRERDRLSEAIARRAALEERLSAIAD